MRPYYEHSGITIYHGDNRVIVPLLGTFDLLLTDPPYGIGEHGGACRTRGAPGYSKHPNMGWDDSIPEAWVFGLMLSKCRDAVIWGGNYFSEILPPKMGWLYWQKLMGGDFSDGELAWTSRDAALREFTKCPKGINKQHPCEKPLPLFNWCLGFFPESKTVLDPWAGSGTTGLACKDCKRECVLIEAEEHYCEIAAKRLSQEVLAL